MIIYITKDDDGHTSTWGTKPEYCSDGIWDNAELVQYKVAYYAKDIANRLVAGSMGIIKLKLTVEVMS